MSNYQIWKLRLWAYSWQAVSTAMNAAVFATVWMLLSKFYHWLGWL